MRKQALLFMILGLTLSAGAAPVTTDLWDSSQAGFSNLSNVTFAGGSFCGAFGNIFGGQTPTSCGAIDSFTGFGFGDSSPKLVLRWNTAEITIGNFALYSPTNFGDPNGEIIGLRLFTVGANNATTQIFEQLSIPATNDGSTPLISATLNTPATSNLWQVEFLLQNSTQGAPIFQIIELDGFAPEGQSAVPEPSTNVLIGAGILALVAATRRVRK